MKVFLSPSSQEKNLGVIQGYVEETICNRITDSVEKVLQLQGVTVARNNPDATYKDHVKLANSLNVDAYVCIHTNAASDPSAEGLRAGCYDPNDKGRDSTRLTEAIYNRLAVATPSTRDKLVQYRFHEVVYANAPVAYLEVGFHTNATEAAWIMASTAQIGLAIAQGVLDYLGIPYVEPQPATLYRVQAGAFTDKARAEALADQLIKAGFNAIVRKG